MSRQIDNYYNRFDPANGYEEVLIREGYGMQGSEINEIQSIHEARRRKLARALFKDGDVISGAQMVVDPVSGHARAQAGTIFLNGDIYDVEAAEFDIPVSGTVAVGIRMISSIISELEDPGLINPAIGMDTEGQPGAWRRKVALAWGFDGDGGGGDFYPVYMIDDGVQRSREAPPALDSFNQAIARYDRDSTGSGTYVCRGMTVSMAEDLADGRQVYCLAEGRARVGGLGLELPVSRRVYYAATPDLRQIGMEVVLAREGKTRVDVAHPPVKSVDSLRVTWEESLDMVHGAWQGCADQLPVTGVVKIVEVRQLDKVFTEGVDFSRRGDSLDWSLSGEEPANGSTYAATVQFLKDVEPEERDLDGFSVSGAVPGSQIIFGYSQMLPRYDRLAIDAEGQTAWFKGIASEQNPVPPPVPENLLALCTVYQNWRPSRQLSFDADCVFSFASMASLQKRLDLIAQEMSRNRLEIDAGSRESGARKGIFVDPLTDDSMRDQGLEQNAAIVDGLLMLPSVDVEILHVSGDVKDQTARPWSEKICLEQPLRTGEMQVNPYMAFDIMPAIVSLDPEVDRWTETRTTWTSDVTKIVRSWHAIFHNFDKFDTALDGVGGAAYRVTANTTSVETLSRSTSDLEYLRQIEVAYKVSGFGPGERLESASFDGIDLMPQIGAKSADASGAFSGSFTIPANVPAGAKAVVFRGAGGTRGSATFVGQGSITVQTMRNVTLQYGDFYEPIAQTFAFGRPVWMAGVDLWFTAKNTQARVQLRNVENGMPGRQIMAEAWMEPENISLSDRTRFLFDCPILLEAGREYAFVVMCNDPDTRAAIAQMGKFDESRQQWVSSQAYTVGVLLSSSNASAWTAHQDMDLTFRILEADFQNDEPLEIDLGKASLDRATDLLLLSVNELPSSDASCEYILSLPGGGKKVVAPGQPISLGDYLSGEVGIMARLCGTAANSPVLWPDARLIAGSMAEAADYFTRSIPARGAVKATLVYEAIVPAGASVTPQIQVDGGEWAEMEQTGAVPGDNGMVEYTCQAELANASLVKARFTLSGTPAARPYVANIRLLATA